MWCGNDATIKPTTMYYEINVSLDGQHFFATAARSITTTFKLREVLHQIVTRFPKEEGFVVTVSEEVQYGIGVKVADIFDENSDFYK